MAARSICYFFFFFLFSPLYHYSFGSRRGCEQKFISTDFVFLSRRSACHQQRRRGGNKRERPPGSGPPPHAPAERSCRRSLLSIHTISDSLAGQRTKECFPLFFCIWNADGTYRRASSYCGRRVMNSVLRTEGATAAAAAAAEATLGTSKQLWKRMEFLFFLFFNGIPIRRKPHRPFMYVVVGRRRRI